MLGGTTPSSVFDNAPMNLAHHAELGQIGQLSVEGRPRLSLRKGRLRGRASGATGSVRPSWRSWTSGDGSAQAASRAWPSPVVSRGPPRSFCKWPPRLAPKSRGAVARTHALIMTVSRSRNWSCRRRSANGKSRQGAGPLLTLSGRIKAGWIGAGSVSEGDPRRSDSNAGLIFQPVGSGRCPHGHPLSHGPFRERWWVM